MLILSEADLVGLLPPLQVVAAVEAALHALDAGQVVVPKRLHVQWKDNTLLTMPVTAEEGSGVKIVSVAPGNAAHGLPTITGLMILNDAETLVPLAIMNAAAVTAQRTGAVGALGVKYLAPEGIDSIGIVGCGTQGVWQAIFACAVRPIREVFAFSRSMAGFEQFAAMVRRHAAQIRVIPCRDVRELLSRTDLVVAATTSATPVLPDEPDLIANKHLISVGSYKPTMQELPDCVYRLAGHLVIDSEHARHESGDVINPQLRGLLTETDIFTITECVTGRRAVDTAGTTAYKSVGTALYDLFVAQAFYRAARALKRGRETDL